MQQMYVEGQIKNFEKRVLTEGLCRAYLPMNFVSFEGNETAEIETAGFKALSSCEFRDGREAIILLEKCVFALIEACGCLVNPKKMELNVKTVYYAADKKEVRFAYVKRAEPVENVTGLLKELIESMDGSIVRGEATAYLRACASCIEECGSLFDIATCLGELREEISSCGR